MNYLKSFLTVRNGKASMIDCNESVSLHLHLHLSTKQPNKSKLANPYFSILKTFFSGKKVLLICFD